MIDIIVIALIVFIAALSIALTVSSKIKNKKLRKLQAKKTGKDPLFSAFPPFEKWKIKILHGHPAILIDYDRQSDRIAAYQMHEPKMGDNKTEYLEIPDHPNPKRRREKAYLYTPPRNCKISDYHEGWGLKKWKVTERDKKKINEYYDHHLKEKEKQTSNRLKKKKQKKMQV